MCSIGVLAFCTISIRNICMLQCFSFTFHLRGSIKSYLLSKFHSSNQTITMHSVCFVVWLSNPGCQKKKRTDRKVCEYLQKLLSSMANRCRSFIKCLHLNVPTLMNLWNRRQNNNDNKNNSYGIQKFGAFIKFRFSVLVTLFFCIKTLHVWENLARI